MEDLFRAVSPAGLRSALTSGSHSVQRSPTSPSHCLAPTPTGLSSTASSTYPQLGHWAEEALGRGSLTLLQPVLGKQSGCGEGQGICHRYDTSPRTSLLRGQEAKAACRWHRLGQESRWAGSSGHLAISLRGAKAGQGTQEQALGSWKLTRLEPITGRQVGGAGPRKPGSRNLIFRR